MSLDIPYFFSTLPISNIVFLQSRLFRNISVPFSVHSCLPRVPTLFRPENRCGVSGLIAEIALRGVFVLLFAYLELQSELFGSFPHGLRSLIIGRKETIASGFHLKLNVEAQFLERLGPLPIPLNPSKHAWTSPELTASFSAIMGLSVNRSKASMASLTRRPPVRVILHMLNPP